MLLYGRIWGNIPDEIFRLWNDECYYTGVWGHNISDAEIIGLWNDERCYTGVWGQYIRCRIIGLWNDECCYNRFALSLLSY